MSSINVGNISYSRFLQVGRETMSLETNFYGMTDFVVVGENFVTSSMTRLVGLAGLVRILATKSRFVEVSNKFGVSLLSCC